MGLFPRSESFEQFFLPLVESEMCKVIVAYLTLDINFLTLSFFGTLKSILTLFFIIFNTQVHFLHLSPVH
jgi:hypothetical protein